MRGRVWGYTAAIAAVVVMALPSGAAAFDAKLKRYPYLTDLVGTSVMVNWATDITATSAVVKYGLAGGTCDTNTVTATRTFILVNGVSEYQWKAQLTGLAADTQYCYRPYFGSAQLDLLGSRRVARLPHPDPGRLVGAVQVRRVGELGQDARGRQPAPGERDLADRAERRALRRHGGRQRLRGRQPEELRRPLSGGRQHERRLRPELLEARGRVRSRSSPRSATTTTTTRRCSRTSRRTPRSPHPAASTTTQTYCCTNGTTQADYPNGWYAFDAGLARFYVLETAWENTNVGTANLFKNDFDNHWGPNSPQYQWLKNDLETHPTGGPVRVPPLPDVLGPVGDQLGHVPPGRLIAGGAAEAPRRDRRLQRSLPQLPAQQRSRRRRPDLRDRRWGREPRVDRQPQRGLQRARTCTASAGATSTTLGYACGAAPVPTGKEQVHHFLLVSVSGTSVTVTPTNSLGGTFDPVTYNAPAQNANLSLTKTDSPDPVLARAGAHLHPRPSATPARAPRPACSSPTRCRAGVTFVSAVPSQGTCSHTSGTVTCSHGHDRQRRRRDSPRSRSGPRTRGRSPTTPRVSSNLNDPITGQQQRERTTTVNPAADLAITNTDSPDPVVVGQQLTYTVGVKNLGPSSATGVTRHRHAAGRGDLQLGHAVAGQLLAVGGHGHLLARERSRTARPRRHDQGHAAVRRHDHEPGERDVAHAATPTLPNNGASAQTTVTRPRTWR